VDQAIHVGNETILTHDHKPLKLERLKDKDLQLNKVCSMTGSITLAGQEHYYLETHSALVIPNSEKKELTVHATCQGISGLQGNIAYVLGIPENRIIVKCKRTGGAFGGKERCATAIMAAVAAHKLQRPCRFTLDRKVDVDITGHRHETKANYSFSFTNEGKITQSNFTCDYNVGFSSDVSLVWGNTLLSRLDGGYTLRNFVGQAFPRKTNLSSNTAFRGFGGPEATLIVEDIIERISHQLKKDPREVREINMTKKGDLLHHGTKIVPDDNLHKCFEECLRMSNYQEERKNVIVFNADPKNKFKRCATQAI
jgi:xanthine dehydrogenase/oxidase